jgi:DHA2 family multidrug resistance protein
MAMSRQSKLIVFVAVLASLLEIIDTSIVNVALPTMMGNLGATLEDISMVVTGYAIANAIILPASAWLSERFGRRKYYLTCIVLFTATSIACGFAPNLYFLIVFRILQGAAGGALLPTSQTLIYEQFPKEKAGMAGAIFGMSVMVGPALGPVLGGYLTDQFGWRSIFNVNLPLGLLALAVGSVAIHDPEFQVESRKNGTRKLDAFGLGLLIAGIGCLQYMLERGEADDWFSSTAIIMNAIVAAVCLPTFIWWELRAENPIINVRLFLDPIVRGGVTLMAAVGFFLYSVVFLMPTFLARTYGYDATQIGMLFIPGSLVTMFMMPIVGRLMQAGVNVKLLIAIGFVSIEATLYLMTQFSPVSSEGQILRSLYMRGFALAFLFVPINSSILSQFTGSALGQVSGLMNLFRQIGGSMGIAMVATLLNSRSHQNYLDLVSKVSPLNPTTQTFFNGAFAAMKAKMGQEIGMAVGQQAVLKVIFYKIQAQVFMITFLQLIFIMMLLVSLVFIPLARLRFRSEIATVTDAH